MSLVALISVLLLSIHLVHANVCIQEWTELHYELRAKAFLPLPQSNAFLTLRKNSTPLSTPPNPLWLAFYEGNDNNTQPTLTQFQNTVDPPLPASCSYLWTISETPGSTLVGLACDDELLLLNVSSLDFAVVDRQPWSVATQGRIVSAIPYPNTRSTFEGTNHLVATDQNVYLWVCENTTHPLFIDPVNMTNIKNPRPWLFRNEHFFGQVLAVDEEGFTQLNWDRSKDRFAEGYQVTQVYAQTNHAFPLDIVDAGITEDGLELILLIRILRNERIEFVVSEWVLNAKGPPTQKPFALGSFTRDWTSLYVDHTNEAVHVFAPEGRKLVIPIVHGQGLRGIPYQRRLTTHLISPRDLVENEEARNGIPLMYAFAPSKGTLLVTNWGESEETSRLTSNLTITKLVLDACPESKKVSKEEQANRHGRIIGGSLAITIIFLLLLTFNNYIFPSPSNTLKRD